MIHTVSALVLYEYLTVSLWLLIEERIVKAIREEVKINNSPSRTRNFPRRYDIDHLDFTLVPRVICNESHR